MGYLLSAISCELSGIFNRINPVKKMGQISITPGQGGRFEKSWYVIIIFDIVRFSKIESRQLAPEMMNWLSLKASSAHDSPQRFTLSEHRDGKLYRI
jgi:hypothetical protein